jgi:hypothetical protein
MAILQDPPVTDTVFVEYVHIACHAPEVENQQPHASEDGEDVLHRVDASVILYHLHQMEEQEEDYC